LLDVDPAHVREDDHRTFPAAVPGDRGEILLHDRRLLLDEHAARPVSVDLEPEDRVGRRFRLVRRVGELDAARLHAPAGQDLRLQHDGTADLGDDLLGRGGTGGDATLQQWDAVAGEERLGFELVEAHAARGPNTRARRGSRRRGTGDRHAAMCCKRSMRSSSGGCDLKSLPKPPGLEIRSVWTAGCATCWAMATSRCSAWSA